MPKIKIIRSFNLVSVNGVLKHRKIYYDYTKKNFIKEIKKIKKNCIVSAREKGLPLALSKVSKIIGNVKPRKKWSGKTFNYGADYQAEAICNKIFDTNDILGTTEGKQYRVLPGTYMNSINAIDTMSIANKSNYTYFNMIKAIESRIGIDFYLPADIPYEPKTIFTIPVKPKANSGYMTSVKIAKTRKNSTKITKNFAYIYLTEFIMKNKRPVVDTSLIQYGGREKRIKTDHSDENKSKNTRAIMNLEDVPTLIGQSIVIPYMKAIQKMDEGFAYGGRINGRRNALNVYNNTYSDYKDGYVTANCDATKHDSRVSEEQLVLAFALIYLSYDDNIENEKMFMYSLSSMIFKRLVIPESGLVYELKQGISTGHPFTAIANSICFYLTLATGIYNTCTKEEIDKTYINNAGDDGIIKVPINKIDKINNNIKNYCSTEIDDLIEQAQPLNNIHSTKRVSFLKYVYNFGLISFNPLEFTQNIVFSTSRSRSIFKVLDRLRHFVFMAPFSPRNQIIIECLFVLSYCRFLGIRVSISDIEQCKTSQLFNMLVNKFKEGSHMYQCKLMTKYTSVEGRRFLTSTYDHYGILSNYINDFRRQVSIRKRNFLVRPDYPKTFKSTRLTVFDMGKVVTQPIFNYNISKALAKVYDLINIQGISGFIGRII